jgi:hypothetical protein
MGSAPDQGEPAVRTRTRDDGDWLDWIKSVTGLAAAAAAIVYATGALVIELELKYLRLPSSQVLGELPRGSLLSVGLTEVVVPSVLLAVVLGVIELGQGASRRMQRTHHRWPGVDDPSYRVFLSFYAGAPVLLLAPAAAYAIAHDPRVQSKGIVLGAIALACLGASGAFAWTVRVARAKKEEAKKQEPETQEAETQKATAAQARGPAAPHQGAHPGSRSRAKRFWRAAAPVLAAAVGPLIWLTIGGLIYFLSTHKREGYMWFGLGAVPTVLVAVLVVWIRGLIGDTRTTGHYGINTLIVFSWAATALLLTPALVAWSAVQAPPEAKVCLKPTGSGDMAWGQLVGETGSRLYLGRPKLERLTAIPQDEIARVYVGKHLAAVGC